MSVDLIIRRWHWPWMSVDLIIRRWHWPKERLQSYRLLCKPAAVQVQSQQELWKIWVVQRFIRLLHLKRLNQSCLNSICGKFFVLSLLPVVLNFFLGKIGMRMRKNKENRSVFSLASNCSDHDQAVQSGIQNKGKITNKFNDHIIRYKCFVLTKFTCFSWQV